MGAYAMPDILSKNERALEQAKIAQAAKLKTS
jgi:hypothetical protein